jgi:hypothetical protein
MSYLPSFSSGIELVLKVSYERRAFTAWTLRAIGLITFSYAFPPGPAVDAGNAAVNVYYIYGLSSTDPQTWMPGWAWQMLLIVGLPVVMFAPVHFVLAKWRGIPSV